MKKVTVAVTLDSSFVNLLNANVSMRYPGWSSGEIDKEVDVAGALAIAILAEARGAPELQVHASIPHMWRPHIEVAHELRKVEVLTEKAGKG